MDLNNTWSDKYEPKYNLSLPLLTLGKAQYFKDEAEDDIINGFISSSLSDTTIENSEEVLVISIFHLLVMTSCNSQVF